MPPYKIKVRDHIQPRTLKSGSPLARVCLMNFQGADPVILLKRVQP